MIVLALLAIALLAIVAGCGGALVLWVQWKLVERRMRLDVRESIETSKSLLNTPFREVNPDNFSNRAYQKNQNTVKTAVFKKGNYNG